MSFSPPRLVGSKWNAELYKWDPSSQQFFRDVNLRQLGKVHGALCSALWVLWSKMVKTQTYITKKHAWEEQPLKWPLEHLKSRQSLLGAFGNLKKKSLKAQKCVLENPTTWDFENCLIKPSLATERKNKTMNPMEN